MSRIGRKHIAIPAGVEVKVNGHEVTVKGPKATLTQEFHHDMAIAVEDGAVVVTRPSDETWFKAFPKASAKSWRSTASATAQQNRAKTW